MLQPFGLTQDTVRLIKDTMPGLYHDEWKHRDVGIRKREPHDRDSKAVYIDVQAREELKKDASGVQGVTTGLGTLPYPLEAPAKLLYPILTPLRNRIARRVVGGRSLYWKVITAINTAGIWGSVAEATASTTGRNTVIKYNEADKTSAFKNVEMESFYTEEAMYGGQSTIVPQENFDNAEFATLSCLQSTMRAEELLDLGGNITALGTPAAVTTTTATTGGTLAAATWRVRMSALTLQGYLFGSAQTPGTQANGRSGGVDSTGETIASTAASQITTGSTSTITATGVALRGAVGYNWYIDDGAAGAYKWAANTVVATYTFLAVGTGNPSNTADQTANALDYDGIIAQTHLSTNNAYWKDFAAATLTGDNQFGIAALNDMFLDRWLAYKTGMTALLISANIAKKISTLVVGSTSPVFRIQAPGGGIQAANIAAGTFVGSVLNPYMMEDVPLVIHPDLPDGMILGLCEDLGRYYPNANISANLEMMLCWDYQREDFAYVARKREFGVSFSGGLVIRAPFAFGAIVNISSA